MANYEAEQRDQIQAVTDGMAFANSDTDGDGRVGRDEFLAVTVSWLPERDKTGNGGITLDDFSI